MIVQIAYVDIVGFLSSLLLPLSQPSHKSFGGRCVETRGRVDNNWQHQPKGFLGNSEHDLLSYSLASSWRNSVSSRLLKRIGLTPIFSNTATLSSPLIRTEIECSVSTLGMDTRRWARIDPPLGDVIKRIVSWMKDLHVSRSTGEKNLMERHDSNCWQLIKVKGTGNDWKKDEVEVVSSPKLIQNR